MSCAAGAPSVTSPAANTLATAVATAAQQNPTAAAQVIASAASRAHPLVLLFGSVLGDNKGLPCAVLLTLTVPYNANAENAHSSISWERRGENCSSGQHSIFHIQNAMLPGSFGSFCSKRVVWQAQRAERLRRPSEWPLHVRWQMVALRQSLWLTLWPLPSPSMAARGSSPSSPVNTPSTPLHFFAGLMHMLTEHMRLRGSILVCYYVWKCASICSNQASTKNTA